MSEMLLDRTNILLVDDHALFRGGLRLLLAAHVPLAHIFEAATQSEALSVITTMADLHLCLLDLTLGDQNGFELLTRIREQAPGVAIIIVSGFSEPAIVHQCLAAGAMSFVPKSASAQTLALALRKVLNGEIYLPEAVFRNAATPSAEAPALTQRQQEVLCGLVLGFSAKVIAQKLGLSVNTVNDHIAALYALLGVHTRAAAVIAATLARLDPPRPILVRMLGVGQNGGPQSP